MKPTNNKLITLNEKEKQDDTIYCKPTYALNSKSKCIFPSYNSDLSSKSESQYVRISGIQKHKIFPTIPLTNPKTENKQF